MSPAPRKPSPFNLNSALALLTLTGMVASGIWFFAPLKTLPDDMRGIRADVNEVQRTQAVQTEAIKTLAEVARDTRDLRRDLDRTTAEHAAHLHRHDTDLEALRNALKHYDAR